MVFNTTCPPLPSFQSSINWCCWCHFMYFSFNFSFHFGIWNTITLVCVMSSMWLKVQRLVIIKYSFPRTCLNKICDMKSRIFCTKIRICAINIHTDTMGWSMKCLLLTFFFQQVVDTQNKQKQLFSWFLRVFKHNFDWFLNQLQQRSTFKTYLLTY